MKKTNRGRPKKDAGLDKDTICKAALKILDNSESRSLSMRQLAADLNVSPMAIYNHFPNRTALLHATADFAYQGVGTAQTTHARHARSRTKHLLMDYYNAVARHPNLSLSIFTVSDVIPTEARRITEELRQLLLASSLPPRKRGLWLDILVDFTHGSSIATAVGASSGGLKDIKKQVAAYARELDELLACIF